MHDVEELLRLPSPAPRPQALACDGETLWMGSLATHRLYEIDSARWTVRSEAQAPGPIFGITVAGDEIFAIIADDNDDRAIHTFIPGHGFRSNHVSPCPEGTGSQLGFDGDRLYVSQWYNKRILSLDQHGHVGTIIEVPHGICGQVIVNGRFYLLTTDDESTNDYYVTRVDARSGTLVVEDLARVPFQARALAFDGKRFWTNHREQHEIVAFTIPGLASP
jgi:hypothetical protein